MINVTKTYLPNIAIGFGNKVDKGELFMRGCKRQLSGILKPTIKDVMHQKLCLFKL